MDTLTFERQGRTFDVPVAVAFDVRGNPTDLIGDREPEHCDHRGARWSGCLDVRCPRCGSRLFLPPSKLAELPEEIIEAMHTAWARAGWPEWNGGKWNIVPDRWTLTPHPLFAHVGGLPVRNDRLWAVQP